MGSKLAQIRKALEENPNIRIKRCDECDFLPGGVMGSEYRHMLDFCIVPKISISAFDTQKLQALMFSLVPNLEPTSKRDFVTNPRGNIEFGNMTFVEAFGRTMHRCEVRIDDLSVHVTGTLHKFESRDGVWVHEMEEPFHREITVQLFPDEKLSHWIFPRTGATLDRESIEAMHNDTFGAAGIVLECTEPNRICSRIHNSTTATSSQSTQAETFFLSPPQPNHMPQKVGQI